MAFSVRVRFEVFKRDDFTCGYCGRRSPDVVLEVDHIVPQCEGGTDDPINLRTSCWECNRGKAGIQLASVMTGEDPHDRAVMMLERRRQLEEYNTVAEAERRAREQETWELIAWWQSEQGIDVSDRENVTCNRQDFNWLVTALEWCPREKIRQFMRYALQRNLTKNLRYVAGCARNWRYDQAAADYREGEPDPKA
jgi:hypothetical protein